jgi:hypothetical protein
MFTIVVGILVAVFVIVAIAGLIVRSFNGDQLRDMGVQDKE